MVKRFASYYRPHMLMFSLDMLCALIAAGCDLFFPMITGNIVDEYIPQQNLRLLLIWSAALIGIFILKAGMNYFVQYYGHCVGVHMQADMRREIFHHMQKLPFSYFDTHKTGTIMSRIVNDLMDVTELAHHGPENLFISARTVEVHRANMQKHLGMDSLAEMVRLYTLVEPYLGEICEPPVRIKRK